MSVRAPAHPLDPKVLTSWRITGLGLAAAAAGAIVLLVLPFVLSARLPASGFAATLSAVVIGGAALAWTVPAVRYRRWRYEIRARDVFLSKGVLFVSMALIPFDRIQFVETKQGPLDRLLGLTQLVVHTAGGNEAIPGLTALEAERMREELSRVVGTLSV